MTHRFRAGLALSLLSLAPAHGATDSGSSERQVGTRGSDALPKPIAVDAKVVRSPECAYPAISLAAREYGTVELEYEVSTTGFISNVTAWALSRTS